MTQLPAEQALYEKLLRFVSAETRTRKHLSFETDIARDLGVDGDDAEEFMQRFQNEFNVDLSTFRFDNYFGGEGFRLVPAIKAAFGKGTARTPFTVAVLFDAAKHGRWPVG